jgi:4-hydroxy-3-methylbut-2-enyl diphosphate reductase IspH
MDVETVGLTAGTSTPEQVIDEVETRVRAMAGTRFEGSEERAGWVSGEQQFPR